MPTKEDLFSYGESLGLDGIKVVSLLRQGGFDGLYSESLHDDYVKYLGAWYKRRNELIEAYGKPYSAARETLAQKAERVMRKVGERAWYFSPISHNRVTGEYRACLDGLKENEELVYEGVSMEDFLGIRS